MTLNWFTLPLKEWRRRPLRTAVTASGVGIAVATLSTVLAFERGYRAGMRGELDRLGAHVLVVPKGCPYDAASLALHGASWPCYLKTSYLQEIRVVPGVASAVPALMTAFYDAPDSPTVYVGTDQEILKLKTGWRISGRFPAHESELLIGTEVALRRAWKVGDAVQLPGLKGERGKVSGVIAPTQGADDFFIYLLVSEAQRLFRHESELTHVLVRLAEPTRMDQVVAKLRSCDAGMNLNVVPLAHLFHTIQRLVNSTRWFLAAVALVALLVAGAGVSNALLMAVAERTREIGVMRAVGASSVDILRLIHLEALAIGLAGGGSGILIAFLSANLTERWLRTRLPFAPAGSLAEWNWTLVICCLAGSAVVGTLAAGAPAWRACRLSPKEAMAKPAGCA